MAVTLVFTLSACGKGEAVLTDTFLSMETLHFERAEDIGQSLNDGIELFGLFDNGDIRRIELNSAVINGVSVTDTDTPGIFNLIVNNEAVPANLSWRIQIIIGNSFAGDVNLSLAPIVNFAYGVESLEDRLYTVQKAVAPLIANYPTFENTAVITASVTNGVVQSQSFTGDQLNITTTGFVRIPDSENRIGIGEIGLNGVFNITVIGQNIADIPTFNINSRVPSVNNDIPIANGIHGGLRAFWNWVFIIPLAWLFASIGGIFGNSFAWGILFGTIILRTLLWPVYAKTNDATLKMQLAQPELQRMQAKYANRKDPASMQKKQMETMAIYKKHGISIFGCLTPLIQMPIFMAMFQVVQRLPISGGMFAERVSRTTMLFGLIDLRGGGWTDWSAIVLSVLVGITMFMVNRLSTKKPSYMKNTGTQVKSAQAVQTERTMKIVMYVMIIFMVFASIQSNALAFYWVVANIYTTGQTLINRKISEKKFLRKQDEAMGVITVKEKKKFFSFGKKD